LVAAIVFLAKALQKCGKATALAIPSVRHKYNKKASKK
jgi:hypothetical protein